MATETPVRSKDMTDHPYLPDRDGRNWLCVCGANGEEGDEQAASLALYFHRRAGHQPVEVVTAWADPDWHPDGRR